MTENASNTKPSFDYAHPHLVSSETLTQFQSEFIESSPAGSIVWHRGTPYRLDLLAAGLAAGGVWGGDGIPSEFDGGQ